MTYIRRSLELQKKKQTKFSKLFNFKFLIQCFGTDLIKYAVTYLCIINKQFYLNFKLINKLSIKFSFLFIIFSN